MKKSFRKLGALCVAAVATVATVGVSPTYAQAVLPDTGTDLTDWVPVLITGFGAVVALIVGGAFAFKLVWKGLAKASKALG